MGARADGLTATLRLRYVRGKAVLPSYDLGVIAARFAQRALAGDAPATTDRQAAVAAILRAPAPPAPQTRSAMPAPQARSATPAPQARSAMPAPQARSAASVLQSPEEAEILLIRRADRAGDPWSGHMALPGGRRDPGDESLFATAARETLEEVGVDVNAHGVLLARLPDIQAVARGKRVGMVIAPFVIALRADVPLKPNEEVAEAFWTPLGPLARGETAAPYPYEHEGQSLTLPSLRVGERIIWGLTYQMLSALFDALHAP